MVDRDLILRRLAFLDTYLDQLASYREMDLATYQQDWKTQRVIERTLHLAIETCMDIADHMVADRRLRVPETGAESFEILAGAGLVPQELGAALATWSASATSWSMTTPSWTQRSSFASFVRTCGISSAFGMPCEPSCSAGRRKGLLGFTCY